MKSYRRTQAASGRSVAHEPPTAGPQDFLETFVSATVICLFAWAALLANQAPAEETPLNTIDQQGFDQLSKEFPSIPQLTTSQRVMMPMRDGVKLVTDIF